MHIAHLNYRVYKALQDFVHGDYGWQRATIDQALKEHRAILPGFQHPKILELACGGGSLSFLFPREGYLGIDSSPKRIEAAKRDHPGHAFKACDINSPSFAELLAGVDFIFCHAFLHHVGDEEFAGLMGKIKEHVRKPATFLAIEPLLPSPLWRNPFGALIAKLDEGRYVRELEGYAAFFKEDLFWSDARIQRYRWPVDVGIFVVRFD